MKTLRFITAAAIVLIACGGMKSMNIDEYPAWCGEFSNKDRDGDTWGQIHKELTRHLTEARNIIPPEELEELHQVRIRTLEFFVEIAEDKPASEEWNSFELSHFYSDDQHHARNFREIEREFETIVDGLPRTVRNRLVNADCLGGE